jgi:hypothetical protein
MRFPGVCLPARAGGTSTARPAAPAMRQPAPACRARRITRLTEPVSIKFRLGRLEPVWGLGSTPDLTALRATRKVHLAPRGTERRKASRDPGSHQDLPSKVSRVPVVAGEAVEGESWCLVDPTYGFSTFRELLEK